MQREVAGCSISKDLVSNDIFFTSVSAEVVGLNIARKVMTNILDFFVILLHIFM